MIFVVLKFLTHDVLSSALSIIFGWVVFSIIIVVELIFGNIQAKRKTCPSEIDTRDAEICKVAWMDRTAAWSFVPWVGKSK